MKCPFTSLQVMEIIDEDGSETPIVFKCEGPAPAPAQPTPIPGPTLKREGKKKGPHLKAYISGRDARRVKYKKGTDHMLSKV